MTGPFGSTSPTVCTERRTTLLAAYVLGCDGANSIARTAIDAHMTDLKFDQRWLVVDVDTAAELAEWDGVHQVCDTRRAGTYMRVGDTRYRWEFRLAATETADDYRDITRLHPLIAPWTKSIPLDQLHVVRVAEYTFRAQIADRWRDRRIFLLGDAAHLTPPFIGQGMGAGLRDAANLAWKLAAVLSGGLPEHLADTYLDTYEAERKPHARAMIRLGEAGRHGHDRRRRAREAGAPLVAPRLHHLPGVKAARPGQPNAAAAAHRPGRPAPPASNTGRAAVPERRRRRRPPRSTTSPPGASPWSPRSRRPRPSSAKSSAAEPSSSPPHPVPICTGGCAAAAPAPPSCGPTAPSSAPAARARTASSDGT